MDQVADLLATEIVDVDLTDEVGATALMLAAMAGHLDIVQLLIPLGADVDKKSQIIESLIFKFLFCFVLYCIVISFMHLTSHYCNDQLSVISN